MSRSGDGWTTCGLGHRHWGRYGAAGLLLRRDRRPDADIVMQLRVGWSHHGGTWGIPGGARDVTESAVDAALREAAEEASVEASLVEVEGVYLDDHGGWAYATVLGIATAELSVRATGPESDDVRWIGAGSVTGLTLHPGFAASWPGLRRLGPAAPQLLVDAANVVGTRPDGWWRDRAGATRRLRDQLVAVAAGGLPAERLPEPWRADAVRWFPRLVMVTEGQARGVGSTPEVEVCEAAGSGDDAIVELIRAGAGEPAADAARGWLVVTADRELSARVRAACGQVVGPRWLLDLIDSRHERPAPRPSH